MYLRTVENFTGFKHFSFCKLGADNRFSDVVVVKANLRLASGQLQVLDELAEVVFADHYVDQSNPRYSPVARAGDAVVFKPATDVLVTGHATPPQGRPCAEWCCELGLHNRGGTKVSRLHLTGPRHWQWSLVRGWHLSEPEVVDKMPLTYALAYGGHDPASGTVFKPNPAGRGWYNVTRLRRDECYPAPQIQYADQPVRSIDTAIPVAGFGPMARWWASRYRYAGTYGATWRAVFDASPHSVYPDDFDARFFQCANLDWIFSPYLKGDEIIELKGFGHDAVVRAELPGIAIQGVCVTRSGKLLLAPLPLDTIHVDIDRGVVSMVWRATLPQSLGISMLALRSVPLRELSIL